MERRKHKRIQYKEPVQYCVSEATIPKGCLSRDLSESGISIQSYEFFPLDTRVSLNWKLNASQFVDLKGKVVWIQQVPYSDSYQIGFNFTEAELNPKIRDEIRQHIDSLRLY